MKIALRILLIILAAAVLVGGVALIILSRGTADMNLRLDDIKACSSAADFNILEDVTLNGDLTLDINIGKDEIWALILSQYGDNLEQTLSSLCSANHAEYRGIGMHVSAKDGLYFDISYSRFGIPLGCRIFYDLSIYNGALIVTPERFVFAGQDIPPEKLFSAFDMLAETEPIYLPDELSAIHPLSVSTGKDALTVKCKVEVGSVLAGLLRGF